MRLSLNWIQRSILVFAGVFFVLMALGSMMDYPKDRSLGTAQFLLAFILFVVAAAPRKGKVDAE